jgi:N-acetylmuramoyl-L-alanine amidase
MIVNFTPHLQMQAASAAVLLISCLALGHAAAQTPDISPEAPVVTQAVAAVPVAAEPAPITLDKKHVTCVAKVVHHEAGNQPRAGQIAVAHVLVNRVKRGHGSDVCDAAKQPGQFFPIDRYHPDRSTSQWSAAVDVARDVLAGKARDTSKGALFFHANWAKPDRFFRSRTKVARLEDHDFYR